MSRISLARFQTFLQASRRSPPRVRIAPRRRGRLSDPEPTLRHSRSLLLVRASADAVLQSPPIGGSAAGGASPAGPTPAGRPRAPSIDDEPDARAPSPRAKTLEPLDLDRAENAPAHPADVVSAD